MSDKSHSPFTREVYIVLGKRNQSKDTEVIAVCGNLITARSERIYFLSDHPLTGTAEVKPFLIKEE